MFSGTTRYLLRKGFLPVRSFATSETMASSRSLENMRTAAELKSFLIEEGKAHYSQFSLAEKCALLEKISDLEKDDSML